MTIDKEKIVIDYIKSNFFRVIRVDAIGLTISPNLNIDFVLWNERASIPQRTSYSLKPDGTIGQFLDSESNDRNSIVREVESTFTLDLETAKKLLESLQECISDLEGLNEFDIDDIEEINETVS